jgi:hypothetical protein
MSLAAILGYSAQCLAGGAITQSGSTMAFTIAAGVWELPDVTNALAMFVSPTDSTVLTPAAGPGSGSRIDLIVGKQNNFANADSDSRVNITLVAGTAGTPGVAPAVPSGAWKIAQINVPTSAANAAACTLVLNSATTLMPPARRVSTLALLNSAVISPLVVGQRVNVYADSTAANNGDWAWDGAAWSQVDLANPFSVAVGVVNMSLAASASATVSITFPTGRFTRIPYVFAMLQASPGVARKLNSQANAATTSGVTLALSTGDGTSITQGPFAVAWVAIQMTPASSAG